MCFGLSAGLLLASPGPAWAGLAEEPAPARGGPAVALVIRTLECTSAVRPFLCSGVLVAPRVVLTAAHCLRRHPPAALAAVFGETIDGIAVPVETGLVHPDHDGESHAHDLALLLLEKEAPPGFQPATLRTTPPGKRMARQQVRWIGYGGPSAAGGNVGGRREARAPVLTIDEHELRYGAADAMSCRGDSGGPVLVSGRAGEELIGITTWGDPACKRFGVALRIDRHIEFLRRFSARAGAPPRPLKPFEPDQGVQRAPCQGDEDCPKGTSCFGWPGQSRWCTYGGLPPGTFTRPCSTASECGGENQCVALPAGCRCFVRAEP